MLKETGGCGRRRVVVRRTKKRVKRNPTRRTPLCDLPPQHGTINNTIEFDNRKKKKYKTSTLRQPVTMASFRFITINSKFRFVHNSSAYASRCFLLWFAAMPKVWFDLLSKTLWDSIFVFLLVGEHVLIILCTSSVEVSFFCCCFLLFVVGCALWMKMQSIAFSICLPV